MKLKCEKLGPGVSSAILMWVQDGKKVLKEVKLGEEFNVHDSYGHAIIVAYPDYVKVVSYGDAKEAAKARLPDIDVVEKMGSAPKNRMIQEEKTK